MKTKDSGLPVSHSAESENQPPESVSLFSDAAHVTKDRGGYLDMGADISDDGLYRYWLSRRLSMGERSVVFVGLNPSTADARQDDPTIRRCVGFARAWGFDWLYMGNLHAWRSTDPKKLPKDSLESVGPRNQEALVWLTQRAELVVAAWGANKLNFYASTLARRIRALPHARCLGRNADGTPKHPLYLPKTAALQAFGEAQSVRSTPPEDQPGESKEKEPVP